MKTNIKHVELVSLLKILTYRVNEPFADDPLQEMFF